jgi:hypothetical protein
MKIAKILAALGIPLTVLVVALMLHRPPESKREPARMAMNLCVFVDVKGKKTQYESVPDSMRDYFNLLANPPSGQVRETVDAFDHAEDSEHVRLYHIHQFPEIKAAEGTRENYSDGEHAVDKGMICGNAAKTSVASLMACLGEVEAEFSASEHKPGQMFMEYLSGLNALVTSDKRIDGDSFASTVMQVDPKTNMPNGGWRARGLTKLQELHGACNNPTCDEIYTKAVDSWNWFGAKHDAVLAAEIMRYKVTEAARDQLSSDFGVQSPAELGVDQCVNVADAVAPKAAGKGAGGPKSHAASGGQQKNGAGSGSGSATSPTQAASKGGAPTTAGSNPSGPPGVLDRLSDYFKDLLKKATGQGGSTNTFVDALFDSGTDSVLGTVKIDCPKYFPRDYAGSGGRYDPLAKDSSGFRDPVVANLQAGQSASGEIADALFKEHKGELVGDLARYYFEVESEAYFNYLFDSTPYDSHATRIAEFAAGPARCHPDGAAAGAAMVEKLKSQLPNRDAARLAEAQTLTTKKAKLASACVVGMDTRIASLREYLGMNWNPSITPSDAIHEWVGHLEERKREYLEGKFGKGAASTTVDTIAEAGEALAQGLVYATPVGKGLLLADLTVGQTPLVSFEGSGECNFIAIMSAPAGDPTHLVQKCSDAFAEFTELVREREELIQRYPVLGESVGKDKAAKMGYEELASTLPSQLRALVDPSQTLVSCMDKFVAEDGSIKVDMGTGFATVNGLSTQAIAQAEAGLASIQDELNTFCSQPASGREKLVDEKVILNPVFMSSYYDCGRKRFAQAFATLGTPPDTWPSAYDTPSQCAERRDGAYLGCRLWREVSYRKGNMDYLYAMGKHAIQTGNKLVMSMLQFATPMFSLKMKLGSVLLKAAGRGAIFGGGISSIAVGMDYGWDKLFGKPTSPEEERDRALHDFRLGYGSYADMQRTYQLVKAAGDNGNPRVKSIVSGAVTGALFEAFTHPVGPEGTPPPTDLRAESPAAASAADGQLVRLYAGLREAGAFNGEAGKPLETALGKALDSRVTSLYPQLTPETLGKMTADDKIALMEQKLPPPDSTGVVRAVEAVPRDPAETFGALNKGEPLAWTRNGEPQTAKFISYDSGKLTLTLEIAGQNQVVPIEDLLSGTIDEGSLRLATGPSLMGWNFGLPVADVAGRSSLYSRLASRDGITVTEGTAAAPKLDPFLQRLGRPEKLRIDPVKSEITLGDGATLDDLVHGVRELRLWRASNGRVGRLLAGINGDISAGIKKLGQKYRERSALAETGDDAGVAKLTSDIEAQRTDLKAKVAALDPTIPSREKLAVALDETNSRGERALVDRQADLAAESQIADKIADIQKRYSDLLSTLGKDDAAYLAQIIRLLEEQGKTKEEVTDTVNETKKSCGV